MKTKGIQPKRFPVNYGQTNGKKDFPAFYTAEIFPDLQERLRTIKGVQSVPDAVPNHVGMEKINATSAWGRYFVEFASSSTIHGLNHLVAPRRHPIERFLAVLFIFGALILLITLSLIFWHRYQHESTVTILDYNYQNFEVKRPSFIVCPMDNIDERKIPGVFKKYNVEDTPEARQFFHFLSNVTYETMDQTPEFNAVPSDKWLNILFELRDVFYYDYSDIQSAETMWIVTERGICMSVRNHVSVYASMEQDCVANDPLHPFHSIKLGFCENAEIRVRVFLVTYKLQIVADRYPNQYWQADNWTVLPLPEYMPFYNFTERDARETIRAVSRITLAQCDPTEIIEYQNTLRPVRTLQMEYATLAISETTSDIKLRDLSVQQRKCKFPWDGGLEMWPIYTYKMCVMECRYRVIRENCGCYPHFARPTPNIPICNSAQLRCIGNLVNVMFLHRYPPASCGCIPNCNTVSYDIIHTTLSTLQKGSPTNVSVFNMNIEFPRDKFQRVELFGFNDFLTAVGGAAGLFLGASVLSFVEIFYYLTLRLCIFFINERRERKKSRARENKKANKG